MMLHQFLKSTVAMMKPDTLARSARSGFAALVAVSIVSTVTPTPAAAQIIEGDPILVDNPGDEPSAGKLTLREAIAQADATPEDDVIVFADHISVIRLTRGQLWIGDMIWPPNSGALTIYGGEGENRVTIDGGGQSGVLDIGSGSVSLQGLKLINGYSSLGGGLMVWDYGDVTLEDSVVSGNYATTAGGGIFCIGGLTMIATEVLNNYSRDTGGGVYIDSAWEGSMIAIESTFSGNEARSAGGGIFNCNAEVMLIAPTVSDNTARNGGGIYNHGGDLSISSEDFFGNWASRNGGDIYYTTGSFDPADLDNPDILDLFEEKPKGGRRR